MSRETVMRRENMQRDSASGLSEMDQKQRVMDVERYDVRKDSLKKKRIWE